MYAICKIKREDKSMYSEQANVNARARSVSARMHEEQEQEHEQEKEQEKEQEQETSVIQKLSITKLVKLLCEIFSFSTLGDREE